MTGHVILHHRRHPVLLSNNTTLTSSTSSSTFAEVAGGTVAECAVICCCCPCGILHLAVLALYTLPAGICKRMLRKKQRQHRQRLLNKGLVARRRCCSCECNEGCGGQGDGQVVFPIGMVNAAMVSLNDDVMVVENLDEENEVMRLEKEMWDTFYSTGFWRSPSQRDN